MPTHVRDSETFQLIFDGEDIRDGEMDVFALAPALLGVGELFRVANASLNGSDTVVTTAVKADFREGSFEILFTIEQHLRDAAAGLLPVIPLLGANNLYWNGPPPVHGDGLFWLAGGFPWRFLRLVLIWARPAFT